ncbi:hypothetical protein NEAUS05_1545 [Nematocida ausubeli]|nr:hypothetical protein NEAUS07_0263 [Nematocida ausubeli]KAI5148820.1 hypothetical protein NEAUS05_1545 [Nematocida ausubeli]
MECPYVVLGVSKESSQKEIKRAYIQGVKKTHPDMTRHGTDAEFIRIKEAYAKILITPHIQQTNADWDSLPYLVVEISNAKDVKCRCGTIYTDTDQIGPVECMTCSHYIEIIPDA